MYALVEAWPRALYVKYRIAGKFGRGKFGEFGKLSVIRQTKTIQISIYN